MDARFYNSEDIDIERLAIDIMNVYLAQSYQAQQLGNKNQVMVQLKKGGDFEAILGMQAAVTLTLQRTTGGVLAMIGQQRWIDKAAVGTVGLAFFPVLWPLALTAGAGAIRQASLGNQVLNVVDGLARQQQPLVQVGPVPTQMMPQIQQQWGQPPAQIASPYYVPSNAAGGELRCSQCNTPYGPGDTFCSGCGRALTAPRQYCANCNSELKSGVAFCPKCGASAFQSTTTVNAAPTPAPVVQAPAYIPPAPVKPAPPVYTPPVAPAPPVYTPPVAPAPPVYTPPVAPAPPPYVPPTPQAPVSPPPTQVYYVPSSAQPATPPPAPKEPEVYYVPSNAQPTVEDQPVPKKPDVYYVSANAQPTVEDQPAPKKPEVPYYVPPVASSAVTPPQPKVTIVPAAPAHEPPPPQKQRPQKQYYIPSHQAAAESLTAAATGDTVSASPASADDEMIQPTLPASPAPSSADEETLADTSSSAAPAVQWGSLTFSDGTVLALAGERAVVGRYDHDLGGVHPEVDLEDCDGSDTVSRVHAAFEHTSDAFLLTDLNSTNATRVNGKRLVPDTPTPLHDGDTLQFGKVVVTFKADA